MGSARKDDVNHIQIRNTRVQHMKSVLKPVYMYNYTLLGANAIKTVDK